MLGQHRGERAFRLGWYSAWLLAIVGCGESSKWNSRHYASGEARTPAEVFLDSGITSNVPAAGATAAAPPAREEDKTAGTPIPPAVPRKIIYNAQVDLVVESMTATAEAVTRLVKANGGYISETNSVSYSQQQRQATWKVRVPVDRFDAFLAEVGRLGELQKNHLDSQDVTQEYYDIDARIANKQQEEKRLLKHLADSTGKLEDILAVERELSRVRGEIEQMQGRLRFLANQTALSTVTISAIELKDYVPPVSPTFGTQVARTFSSSFSQLVDFGMGAVLLVVAVILWLPVAIVLALPFAWLLHRIRNPRPRRQPGPERA